MTTTSNDTTRFITIYELERLVVGTSAKGRRRVVHLEHIAFYTTLENAEEAMRAYILQERECLGDELYYDGCLNYIISERRVYRYPNTDEDICTVSQTYTPDGEVCPDKTSQPTDL